MNCSFYTPFLVLFFAKIYKPKRSLYMKNFITDLLFYYSSLPLLLSGVI